MNHKAKLVGFSETPSTYIHLFEYYLHICLALNDILLK